MLFVKSSSRPDIKTVRRIKQALYEAVELPEGAIITISQLACMEEDCAPLETVIGLLRPGEALLQHKVHKAVSDIESQDLVEVCASWGFEVNNPSLESFKQILTRNKA